MLLLQEVVQVYFVTDLVSQLLGTHHFLLLGRRHRIEIDCYLFITFVEVEIHYILQSCGPVKDPPLVFPVLSLEFLFQLIAQGVLQHFFGEDTLRLLLFIPKLLVWVADHHITSSEQRFISKGNNSIYELMAEVLKRDALDIQTVAEH